MMWARGISEFGAVIILTYFPMVTSILIYQRFESYGLTQAVPMAALLVIVCALIFIGFSLFYSGKRNMIELKNVHVKVADFSLQQINLTASKGTYTVVLGPTGAGKTVLLESIAGLHTVHEAR